MKKIGRIAAAVATAALVVCAAVAIAAEKGGVEITASQTEEPLNTTLSAQETASSTMITEENTSSAISTIGESTPTITATEENTASTDITAENASSAAEANTTPTTATKANTAPTATATTGAATAAATAAVSSGNRSLTVSASVTNSWEEEGKNCYQVDGIVKNTGSSAVGSWSVKLPSAKGITVKQAWNCKLTVSDAEMTAVNESYNGELNAGDETSFGFIISTPSAYSIGGAAVSEPPRATAADTVIEPEDAPASLSVSGGLVSEHGRLHLDGTQIKDEHGNAVQLTGMSTHGIQWFPDFVNKAAFKALRDDWNTNVVRIAMYTGQSEGYTAGSKAKLEALAEQAIQDCIALDMYVIMDWHVLADGNPNIRKEDALEFFGYISETYGDYPNIIYEICNEPNGNVTWDGDIKPYAEEVIAVIRGNDKDNLIIVGTPTWSQDIDKALANPLNDDGVLYALHFYADTHKQWLRDRVSKCISGGLPVFASEFGMCDASGAGSNNYTEATAWLEFFDDMGISYCAWALADKNETCCVIKPGAGTTGDWTENELTESGKWLRKWFGEH